MSLLPELVFRAVLVRGIRMIKEDTRFLDSLFPNLDQESAGTLRDFMLKNTIYIDINYPRDALKLPAIIILLRSEQEAQAYLADSMGTGELPDELSYDSFSDYEIETLGGTASTGDLGGLGKAAFGPALASSGTNNTLKFAAKVWANTEWLTGKGHTVHLIGGTGAGQQRQIVANSQDTLMVSPDWNTVPDSTTAFVIRGAAEEVIGEPRSAYDRANAAITERIGGLYGLNYQIQIIGPNPELTIYLHAIVKSIFTLSRNLLERNGVINLKMSATDFLPKPEYQPDYAYMRALNVEFLSSFDLFREMGGLATSFRLALEQTIEEEKIDGSIDRFTIDLITPISAAFSYTQNGAEFEFVDESTAPGPIVLWHWDFGDGVISSVTNPTHTYADSQQRLVVLTTTDNAGNKDSTQQFVQPVI